MMHHTIEGKAIKEILDKTPTQNKRKSGKYPVTAEYCPICIELQNKKSIPAVDQSFHSCHLSPTSYPVHNWYTFVHSYSPKFVAYEIKKNGITRESEVLDPFAGAGTTLVECKLEGINSFGLDALDFLVLVSNIKTKWDINIAELRIEFQELMRKISKRMRQCRLDETSHSLDEFLEENFALTCLKVEKPQLLKEAYVSPKPLVKLYALKTAIDECSESAVTDIFRLAFSAIIVPSSNVRFGPNFGLIKPVKNVDVIGLFSKKVLKIISDLKSVQKLKHTGHSIAVKDDSRNMTSIVRSKAFSNIITSPPYPQEHDYTRQVRLELVFLDYIKKRSDLKTIKKDMLRASTRNIYVNDNDRQYVLKFKDIVELMNIIEKRVKDTNGTSGFEKLYGTLVGEYFGGMYRCLDQIYQVLDDKGKASLLVGDSHSFKMVHIKTAELLAQLGLDIGFKKFEIKLWQNIRSTAHNYPIQENILRLYK